MRTLAISLLLPLFAFANDAKRYSALPADLHQTLPDGVTLLDDKGRDNGVRFVDLNGDSLPDIVMSNPRSYGVYLFNPEEKKGLQWFLGWTQVLREGKAGDANALPLIVNNEGNDAGVVFENRTMIAGAVRMSYEDLLRIPGPAPKSPEESLKALHVKPGYEVKLIASEPMVQDPVYVDWDAKGRMWVVEMGDYPFAPGETTKDGKVGQGKVSDLQQGRIKILEDTNRDGVMDKVTLFLDGLHHPTGLAHWKNGVFVSAIPDIFFAEDTDGDSKCDKREVWFSGFTAGNPQHLVNGFSWGLDGWFHGANGDSGGKIKAAKTGKEYDLSASDFRFNPIDGEFELEAGRSQYGKWRDDFGNWFGNNNVTWAWHYWLPLKDLARNPNLAVKSLREETNNDKRIFPVSPAVRRFNQQSTAGTLTSGCSPMPARSAFFPDTMFICEPANNLVHREVIDYSGATIKTHRHPDDVESEFLASEDNWFRPSMARTGPDGALYVVDMYRLVLEHPEWIPAEIVKGLNVRAGEDKGRIYRIAPKDAASPKVAVRPNGWRLDYESRRRKEGAVMTSTDAARFSTTKFAEMQAMSPWVDPPMNKEEWLRHLSDSNPHVRVNALRVILEQNVPIDGGMIEPLVNDPSPMVRLQLALTAGVLPEPERYTILEALIKKDSDSPAIITAARSSFGKQVPAALNALASGAIKKSADVPKIPVITNNNPDRQKVVQQYAGVAKLTGDAKRGHTLSAVCAACHKLKGEGNEIGPDLGTVANKPIDQLVESILDPNRAVEQRYVVQAIKLKEGGEKAGLIIEENPNNLTLRTAAGVELVLVKDIASRTSTNRTLMPEGLESVLKPQDVADILAWMK